MIYRIDVKDESPKMTVSSEIIEVESYQAAKEAADAMFETTRRRTYLYSGPNGQYWWYSIWANGETFDRNSNA